MNTFGIDIPNQEMWFEDTNILHNDRFIKEIFINKKRFPIQNGYILDQYIQLYNGKTNIYSSVYWYDKEINNNNVRVDKIFIDFDPDPDNKFFDDVKKVATYLHNNNIAFSLVFSGRGFHIFIALDTSINLKNPKMAIKKYVADLHNKTNTTSDPAVVGDLRRVCRCIGTINLKTGLYCTEISYYDLMNLSYESICNMCKEQHYTRFSVHGDSLDISEFDITNEDIEPILVDIDIGSIDLSFNLPPCIGSLLKEPNLGYHERRELIIYLRDMGYEIEEVEKILEEHLSPNKFEHCVFEENQVKYLFNREDILFSSCKTQKLNGICSSSTCEGNNLYI